MLSIVIPAYNEEKRLPPTLKKIDQFLQEKQKKDSLFSYEIIVVSDGSKDNTKKVAINTNIQNLSVIEYPLNKGKGYAVKVGLSNAKGDDILFTDADLSTPIEEIDKFLSDTNKEFDAIIASRALKGSNITKHQSQFREFLGKSFNKLVRMITGLNIKDTQCGFKLYSKKAAKIIVNKQKIKGFCFDVEQLYILKKHKLKIKELPVTWINDEESKVDSFKDSLHMLKDILKIKWIHR